MTKETPSDKELWRLISTLEDEMYAEGMSPKERHFQLPIRAMERLGHRSFQVTGKDVPPLLNHIEKLHGQLYRRKDVAAGGIHGGAFMFRGIAVRIYIPIIYGGVSLDLFEYCDLTPRQIDWLRSSATDEWSYVVNFCNLFDFSACLHPLADYGSAPPSASSNLRLSSFQTQSAAATLCAAFDQRGAVQSSLIAAELALKAALAGAGVKDRELKNLGHILVELVKAVGEEYKDFELEKTLEHTAKLPSLVPNRYSSAQPGRNDTGVIVMASQAVSGAVARVLTGSSLLRIIESPQFRTSGG